MGKEPQENSDLLAVNNKPQINGNARHRDDEEIAHGPPDGGLRAYAVILGSFLTNGIVFGVINSYSVIYSFFVKQLVLEGVSNLTAVLGGSIATAALIISSFVSHSLDALYFTYGIMFGMGASLAYTPSLAILGHYFKKHLGLANGIVTIGSSVFTVILPPVMEYMLTNYGLEWLFRLLAVFAFGVALCGLLFKPSPMLSVKPIRADDSCKARMKSVINTEIWRNRKYKLWALSMPIALLGYFVPYVHIKEFIMDSFHDVNYNLPLQCIAITSGLGKLLFGFIADHPRINRIMMQQISFYVIGTLTIILPFVKSFPLLVTISLGMGLFDGGVITLIGPVAFELCGASHGAQAIGCMLGLAAPSLSIGPPVAGFLHGLKKDYTVPFVLAGIFPLIGASLMCVIRCQKSQPEPPESNGHALTMISADSDT
ncbi:Karmoisin, partial [Operophtera brumata]